MKSTRAFFTIILFLCIKTFAQSDTVITSLYGFEDLNGNTQLVYQIHATHFTGIADTTRGNYNIFSPITGIDKLIFNSYLATSSVNPPPYDIVSKSTSGFHFFENNPDSSLFSANYLVGDVSCGFERNGFVFQYYGPSSIDRLFAFNDSVWAQYNTFIITSTDRGNTWSDWRDLDSVKPAAYRLISISPFNRQIFFGVGDDGKLLKSYDQGKTSSVVHDEDYWAWNSQMLYDADGKHIYGVTNHYGHTHLLISDNQGNENSWTVYSEYIPNKTSFAIDDSINGEIYYSDENQIYRSTDYGTTFSLFYELPEYSRITGLYKKAKSSLLYCSTQNFIYEISNRHLKVVKQFNVKNNLDYYPLAIGNKWVYKVHGANTDPVHTDPFDYNESITVKKDSLHSDGHHYFVEEIKRVGDWGGVEYNLVRIDTLNGKVIIAGYGDYGNVLVADFLAMPGDYFYTIFGAVESISESLENIFGENRRSLEYNIGSLLVQYQKYVSGIGLVYEYHTWDFGSTKKELKGCVVNGKLYGDTLTVGVEDDLSSLPTQFELKQNYPNPFNPSTTIEYVIPNVETRHGTSSKHVTLKVYDILGREVATLVNEYQLTGKYSVQFNAETRSGESLPSGIYFYTLRVGDSSSSRFYRDSSEFKKMVLIK